MKNNKYPDDDSAIDSIGVVCIIGGVISIGIVIYLLYEISCHVFSLFRNLGG